MSRYLDVHDLFHIRTLSQSKSAKLPRTSVECQASIRRSEGNSGTVGNKEDIAGLGLDLLARRILEDKGALEDDLGLVVCVRVFQRLALIDSEETHGDGLLGAVGR